MGDETKTPATPEEVRMRLALLDVRELLLKCRRELTPLEAAIYKTVTTALHGEAR